MNQAAIEAWKWASLEAEWPAGEMLVLGAEAHEVMGEDWRVSGYQPHRGLALGWEQAGHQRIETIEEIGKAGAVWPNVLVLGAKSREDVQGRIAYAWSALRVGGRLMVSIANDLGAARYEKDVARVLGELDTFQKCKCRVFSVRKQAAEMPAEFCAWLEMSQPREIPENRGWMAQAGVFSPTQTDAGSALLVANFPADLRGKVADFGAGWGALAGAACEKFPKLRQVDLYEVDARAVACARENLREFGEKVRCFWHDLTREPIAEEYDAILCNPPFHEGNKASVGLGRDIIQKGVSALKKGGRLLLVANRQLPYEEELSRLAVSWRPIAENATYKILLAIKR